MSERNKLEILQAVRGIAAIGIVYFHTEYGPWKSANWGVDFFFLLSGFLAMLSTRLGGGQRRFWFSRITKICPLYYIMTAVVIALYRIVPNVFRTTIVTTETILKSFLFIPCYASNGKIYPVYSVAWTLTLEMFFYVVFSLCMKINHKKRGGLAVCALAGLAALGKIATFESAVLTFWTDKHLLEFAIGIVIYLAYEKGVCPDRKRFSVFLIAMEIIMLFSGKYILGDHLTIFTWNMLWGTCLLVTSLAYGNGKCNKFLVMLGNISYSMYMIHFLFVGLVVRIMIDNQVYSMKNTLLVILTILTVIPISYGVYRVMEVYLPEKIKYMLVQKSAKNSKLHFKI